MTTLRRIVLGLIVVAGVRAAGAQTSCSFTGTDGTCATPVTLYLPGTMTNPRIVRLTPSTTAVTGAATAADYDAGFLPIDGPTFTVQANRGWTLLVSATSATWTATGSLARAGKPAADLSWSTSTTGSFAPLSTTAATVTTGAATAGTTTPLYFRAALDWAADRPGSYSLGVTVTVTTP
jgi:hypothetical protein